ncbi:MAG: hypothetical protein FH749_06905 [Firmicutes bacterium]|nr:hypothetical protein [Bacillota bacterium]
MKAKDVIAKLSQLVDSGVITEDTNVYVIGHSDEPILDTIEVFVHYADEATHPEASITLKGAEE